MRHKWCYRMLNANKITSTNCNKDQYGIGNSPVLNKSAIL